MGYDGTEDQEGGNIRIPMYLWLNHVDTRQKPTQHCKAIILQLKINNNLKMQWNIHELYFLREMSQITDSNNQRKKLKKENIPDIANIPK